MIEVPGVLLGQGEHYVLQVVGDSMIDAGIYDGDYAVVQRCEDAENGTIVVALVDDREVTLKRLRRRGASIALEPANPALRDPDLRAAPGQDPGPPGRPDAALLSGQAGEQQIRHIGEQGRGAGGEQLAGARDAR